ncbi:hypothetical protein DSM104299_03161 [Baekduia alba]|uniref:SHOCT domain-containing protein n=1 Tax=Baekduia alba TaxID=2997333 RepID=UPI002342173A|nr:SHOCT domain-containing protein [Baekduia alba]WCB94425.1 hypothetical protein DSM104299_03161 [Baekduia alba]
MDNGPLQVAVIEFVDGRFTGAIAAAFDELVEADVVSVRDLVFVRKDDDGGVEAFELDELDPGELAGFRQMGAGVGALLNEDDVEEVAAGLRPGSAVALVVWEDRWALRLLGAIREAGGAVLAGTATAVSQAQHLRYAQSVEGAPPPQEVVVQAPPPAASGEGDRIAQLERLAKLREQGLLTDDELAAEKARILA